MCARVLAASCNAESGKDVLMPECLQVFVVPLGKSGNNVTVHWDRHEGGRDFFPSSSEYSAQTFNKVITNQEFEM
jgi:hypothetical protein